MSNVTKLPSSSPDIDEIIEQLEGLKDELKDDVGALIGACVVLVHLPKDKESDKTHYRHTLLLESANALAHESVICGLEEAKFFYIGGAYAMD